MSQDPSRLMVLGTGSGVGKSVIVSGLVRLLSQSGSDVVPFKAQNMSNNSEVAREGGEVATSQAVQSRACGKIPSVHFNPILLKPTASGRSEVLVHGTPTGLWNWKEYRSRHEEMKSNVMQSYEKLRDRHDAIIMEGAGSPAEPNLMDRDLVNLPMAERSDAPVILVGDISKGGVFAWLTGTLQWLNADQRNRVKGFVINKFRGDPTVLKQAIDELEEKTGIPVLGVIPYADRLPLSAEDSMQIQELNSSSDSRRPVRIGLIQLPKTSNFTDFEPLSRHDDVSFDVLKTPDSIGNHDLIVLPGSKNTLADLCWLRENNFDSAIGKHVDRGGSILGVCGGYQMLTETVMDDENLESDRRKVEGLGYFPSVVRFREPKLTRRIEGTDLNVGTGFNGYEIRYGRFRSQTSSPWLRTGDGEVVGRRNGSIYGTTVHGLFRDRVFLRGFLRRIADRSVKSTGTDNSSNPHDRWADHLSEYIDTNKIREIMDSSGQEAVVS